MPTDNLQEDWDPIDPPVTALERVRPPESPEMADTDYAPELAEPEEPEALRPSVLIFRGLLGVLLLCFAGAAAFYMIPRARPAFDTRITHLEPTVYVAPKPTILLPPTQAADGVVALPTDAPVIEVEPIEGPAPTQAPAPAPTAAPTPPPFVAKSAPGAVQGQPNPLFGPNYSATDSKPVFVCASDPYVTHLTLLQIQAQGLDIKNGFHLGIVPLGLNAAYELEAEPYTGKVKSGEWDCALDRLDENAELNFGVITAITDESAGSNGIWGRNIETYYGLRNKKLGYVDGTSSKFFMRYVLALLPPDARKSVQTVPFKSLTEAIDAFNRGEIDAVSAWQPYLANTVKYGGRAIIGTDQLRVIAEAIVVSRKTVAEKPQLVESFHRAWYQAQRVQLDDPARAAQEIARWGHNQWTGVSSANAAADLAAALRLIAPATLEQNIALMKDSSLLARQIESARQVYIADGGVVSDVPAASLLDNRFVLKLEGDADLRATGKPINTGFSLAPETTAASQADASETLIYELPCREFAFEPNSSVLTPDSARVLDVCVIPSLQLRKSASLRIIGSAAWPAGSEFTEDQILGFGLQRAQAIADYLASKGIDRSRFTLEGALPPAEHRQTLDAAVLAGDRYVKMTLVVGAQ